MKIVVIGGTGLIGASVVATLRRKGHEAIAAARSTGVDMMTGEGLADALAGARVVVDVARSPSYDAEAVMHFIQSSGRHLAAAEVAAGVKHHVALSVVGTERLQDSGWFRAKLAQETLIKSAPVPYTIVRATQFFEFIRAIAQHATVGDTVRLAPVQFQPMAADDVASAMVAAALAEPALGTIEIAGPERFTLDEGVRKVLNHDGDAREVIVDPQALYFGARISETTLVPGPNAPLGSTRLDGWLTQVPPPPQNRNALTQNRLQLDGEPVGVKVEISRYVDDGYPGWVECTLVDALGAEHAFVEKAPIVTGAALHAGSSYPQPGFIACVVLARSERDDRRQLAHIDTDRPWGIESTLGKS